MAEWNDEKSVSMSFDVEADEAAVDSFKRLMKEFDDFEKAANVRTKQLFDKYIRIAGEKADEAYNQVLNVFRVGYMNGWNDRKEVDDKYIRHMKDSEVTDN